MSTNTNTAYLSSKIEQAIDYISYRQMVSNLLSEGKTTGDNQSESLLHYAVLNEQRMKRWDKQAMIKEALAEQLQNYTRPLIWLVLTEGWCGDAAQNLPILHKMEQLAPNVEMKVLLRDKHLDLMDLYLTNGGRALPKLICLDKATHEVLGTWGPRPAEAQQIVVTWKTNPVMSHEEMAAKLHSWYAQDHAQAIQQEFMQLLDKWKAQ